MRKVRCRIVASLFPMPPPVSVRREAVELPTYEPQAPDPAPMFLEKRVYQGSSGRVYPLPCTDRIAEQPRPRRWEAVFIENEYVRVMLLPELGGRIHRIQDKTNGYDAVYYQPVIKPALVGLAGPWCSGGIEFNWPQHHRPSTFLPTGVAVERHADGSATVWMSEHDPMARMKGMHGVRLQPGRSCVELRVRAYNRTGDVQTFLWWANVATRVHEGYRSFFPPDVTHVADHAKRATTGYPHATGRYYGVDYAARGKRGIPPAERPAQFLPPHCAATPALSAAGAIPAYRPDDLSWYANIPVPTSYMAMGSTKDFFGGYDYKARAGLVHVASHHIAPGKKQWTWGNHEFGYAWDRNLTDADERGVFHPYIEIMAGAFTDNQPDFSFLQPGETKRWSQYWYPIREIGPAQEANVDAALSLAIEDGVVRIGVAVTAPQPDLEIRLLVAGKSRRTWRRSLDPARPGLFREKLSGRIRAGGISVEVRDTEGRRLIACATGDRRPARPAPPAVAPPAPAGVESGDELFLIGLHLEQYRHATRMPEAYWREALRRDPGDARARLALGRWHLRRGEFPAAEAHLRASIARATAYNPNPYDGEAFYQLGQCLRHRCFAAAGRGPAAEELLSDAYAAFYKATWNHAWQSAAFHALAEIDCCRAEWVAALDHIDRALRLNADNLRAAALKTVILRRLGREAEARAALAEARRIDPLDGWIAHLAGEPLRCDNQVRLDLALDCARAGLFAEGLEILAGAVRAAKHGYDGSAGSGPMMHYTAAWLNALLARRDGAPVSRAPRAARAEIDAAERADPDYCFPARLEDIAILEHAVAVRPDAARAPYYLGNLLYDRRRHREAIACWEQAVKREPGNAIAWRNLGIAYHNVLREPRRARLAYERAVRAAPGSARFLHERDQLWKRLGTSPAQRLRVLRKHPGVVARRDDLSVEFCALCNQTGRPREALAVLSLRRFQPWEGGEGQVLAQYVRALLALGRGALRSGRAGEAAEWFQRALAPPANLGEARHLLANASDIHFWLGRAHAAAGDREAARRAWTAAAAFTGDFQAMSVRAYSEMTYFSALALEKLGRRAEAKRLLRQLLAHARRLRGTKASIDFFATSLPTMLLFDDDLQARQAETARLLEAQALLGLGRVAAGRSRLRQVLRRDPSHALAADLLAASPLER